MIELLWLIAGLWAAMVWVWRRDRIVLTDDDLEIGGDQ